MTFSSSRRESKSERKECQITRVCSKSSHTWELWVAKATKEAVVKIFKYFMHLKDENNTKEVALTKLFVHILSWRVQRKWRACVVSALALQQCLYTVTSKHRTKHRNRRLYIATATAAAFGRSSCRLYWVRRICEPFGLLSTGADVRALWS